MRLLALTVQAALILHMTLSSSCVSYLQLHLYEEMIVLLKTGVANALIIPIPNGEELVCWMVLNCSE